MFPYYLVLYMQCAGDNWLGVTLGYQSCSGSVIATSFFALIYISCNFFVFNLFVAIFLENFELSDEEQTWDGTSGEGLQHTQ